jgi:hypothetical protein
MRGSGFKNLRDLLLFGIGAICLGYYMIHTLQTGGQLQLSILGFFAAVMGAPLALGADKKRRD